MKLKNNKIKMIGYSIFICLITITTLTFISFFMKNDISKTNSNNDYVEQPEFKTLNIASDLCNIKYYAEIIDYHVLEKTWFFSEEKIKNNFFRLLGYVLVNNSEFKDQIEDYEKELKFKLSKNKKEVTFNLFLYNKRYKSKKYNSIFMLKIK